MAALVYPTHPCQFGYKPAAHLNIYIYFFLTITELNVQENMATSATWRPQRTWLSQQEGLILSEW